MLPGSSLWGSEPAVAIVFLDDSLHAPLPFLPFILFFIFFYFLSWNKIWCFFRPNGFAQAAQVTPAISCFLHFDMYRDTKLYMRMDIERWLQKCSRCKIFWFLYHQIRPDGNWSGFRLCNRDAHQLLGCGFPGVDRSLIIRDGNDIFVIVCICSCRRCCSMWWGRATGTEKDVQPEYLDPPSRFSE